MSSRLTPKQEARYPNLVATGYTKTSDKEPKYNCVAWAADWTTNLWWEPYSKNKAGMYWPEGVPDSFYVEAYIRAFRTIGYELCGSSEFEAGFEKIALFEDDVLGLFSHVAKQLPNGKWASKLGGEDDIVHNSLDAFSGYAKYGKATRFMKRRDKGLPLPKNLV